MSRWSSADPEVLAKALIVGEFHPDADALDYLRAQSRADDGRRVA